MPTCWASLKAPHPASSGPVVQRPGAFVGPAIGGSLFFSAATTRALGGEHRSVQLTYAFIGVAVLLFAFFLSRAHLPEVRDADHGPAREGATRALCQQRHFVFGVITQALYVGAQVGIGAFFINLVTESWAGLSSQQGAFLLSAGMLAYLLGRFLGAALMARIALRALLLTYAIINTVLTLVVVAGIDKVSAVAAGGGILLYVDHVRHDLHSWGPRLGRGGQARLVGHGHGHRRGRAAALAHGQDAELWGTPAAFLLPTACFVVVALYAWKGADAAHPRSAQDLPANAPSIN
jgi:FHS family L-fucose permease-like MFS transporter